MTTAARVTATKPLLKEFGEAKRDSLIPILQKAQETHGYLSEEAIAEIGRHLKLPASKVYGVATFYNQFRFTPKGKFHIMLCRGTACHVKQSLPILEAMHKTLGTSEKIKTTADMMFTVETLACLGACGLAPVVVIDEQVYVKIPTTEQGIKAMRELYNQGIGITATFIACGASVAENSATNNSAPARPSSAGTVQELPLDECECQGTPIIRLINKSLLRNIMVRFWLLKTRK